MCWVCQMLIRSTLLKHSFPAVTFPALGLHALKSNRILQPTNNWAVIWVSFLTGMSELVVVSSSPSFLTHTVLLFTTQRFVLSQHRLTRTSRRRMESSYRNWEVFKYYYSNVLPQRTSRLHTYKSVNVLWCFKSAFSTSLIQCWEIVQLRFHGATSLLNPEQKGNHFPKGSPQLKDTSRTEAEALLGQMAKWPGSQGCQTLSPLQEPPHRSLPVSPEPCRDFGWNQGYISLRSSELTDASPDTSSREGEELSTARLRAGHRLGLPDPIRRCFGLGFL